MAIEVPRHEVTLKEEGLLHLFRADEKKFGRGFADGAKSSIPHELPLDSGILAMARHTIDRERKRFPGVDEVQGKDYELGVVIGVWVSLKELEVGAIESPRLREHLEERGGIPA